MLKLYVNAICLKPHFAGKIGQFVSAENGTTANEYGLIAALTTVGTKLTAKFTAVANAL
jgi:Flp pilus assembly pilin Flp